MNSTQLGDYFAKGLDASKPSSPNIPTGTAGFYYATDTNILYTWAAATWKAIASGPDATPYTAGTLDDEFSGTSLDGTRWTWTNQGGRSALVDSSWLTLNAPSPGAGDTWGIITQPTPGTPWTVVSKLCLHATSNSNFTYGGVVLRESSTGKFLALYNDNTQGVGFAWWNSATSFNAVKTNASWGNWPAPSKGCVLYLKVQDDGANIKGSISFSGSANSYHQFYSESRTAFLAGGPNQIGLGVGTNIVAGTTVNLNVDYFRRTQ